MKRQHKQVRRTLLATALTLLAIGPTLSHAEESNITRPSKSDIRPIQYESKKRHWSFAFDNDILMALGRDQDYTYGASLGFAGPEVDSHLLSLHTPLSYLDKLWKPEAHGIRGHYQKIEYGLLGFTPEDITRSDVVPGDRPYASLVYVSSSNETYDFERDVSWNSSITIGMLGLEIVGQLQEEVHDLTEGDKPQGWSHQIASNGEPTARVSIARHSLLMDTGSVELKTTTQGSLGYLSEVGWGLGMRLGKTHTPWASFNPELVAYGENSASNTQSSVFEHYLWAGFALKARAYNAFLQGQFRTSDLDYESDQLRHLITEVWLGYTLAFRNGYRLSYTLRGHSSEIKEGVGNRNVFWGGLKLSKTFV